MTASKTAIYARVSSERQAQEGTIASQVAHLNDYAKSKGIEVEADLIFIDNGVSGSSLIRPALDTLRDKAANGVVSEIIVLSPDRLARRHAHQLILLEEFHRLGAVVTFANRSIAADSAEDQLLLQIQGVISEYEREKIMERHRRGKLHKAKQQSPNVLSGAPYGYLYIRKNATEPARFEIHLGEAKVIRLIYDLYVNKFLSVPKIAKHLDEKKIPTAKGIGGWSPRTIWGILKNPAYMGKAAYGKTIAAKRKKKNKRTRDPMHYPKRVNSSSLRQPKEKWIYIKVPPIISESIFDQVPGRANENKQKSKRNRKRDYLLSGLGYCSECGYTIYGSVNRGRIERQYYRCYGQDSWKGKQYQCSARPIRVEVLDDLIWQQTRKLLESPEQLLMEYADRLDKKKNASLSTEKIVQRKRRDINSLKLEKQRLLDLYQQGTITMEDIQTRFENIRSKILNSEEAITFLEQDNDKKQKQLQLIDNFHSFRKKISGNLETLTKEEKAKIVRLLVTEVAVNQKTTELIIKHILPEAEPKSYELNARSLCTKLATPQEHHPKARHQKRLRLQGELSR